MKQRTLKFRIHVPVWYDFKQELSRRSGTKHLFSTGHSFKSSVLRFLITQGFFWMWFHVASFYIYQSILYCKWQLSPLFIWLKMFSYKRLSNFVIIILLSSLYYIIVCFLLKILLSILLFLIFLNKIICLLRFCFILFNFLSIIYCIITFFSGCTSIRNFTFFFFFRHFFILIDLETFSFVLNFKQNPMKWDFFYDNKFHFETLYKFVPLIYTFEFLQNLFVIVVYFSVYNNWFICKSGGVLKHIFGIKF